MDELVNLKNKVIHFFEGEGFVGDGFSLAKIYPNKFAIHPLMKTVKIVIYPDAITMNLLRIYSFIEGVRVGQSISFPFSKLNDYVLQNILNMVPILINFGVLRFVYKEICGSTSHDHIMYRNYSQQLSVLLTVTPSHDVEKWTFRLSDSLEWKQYSLYDLTKFLKTYNYTLL